VKRAVGRRPGSFSLQAFPCPFQMVHSQEELVLTHGRVHGPRSCRRSPGGQSGKSGGLDGANPDDCRGAHHGENARIRPRLARRVRPNQARPAPGTGAGSLGSRRGESERTRTTAGQSRGSVPGLRGGACHALAFALRSWRAFAFVRAFTFCFVCTRSLFGVTLALHAWKAGRS
jgi:hypothetical protein